MKVIWTMTDKINQCLLFVKLILLLKVVLSNVTHHNIYIFESCFPEILFEGERNNIWVSYSYRKHLSLLLLSSCSRKTVCSVLNAKWLFHVESFAWIWLLYCFWTLCFFQTESPDCRVSKSLTVYICTVWLSSLNWTKGAMQLNRR